MAWAPFMVFAHCISFADGTSDAIVASDLDMVIVRMVRDLPQLQPCEAHSLEPSFNGPPRLQGCLPRLRGVLGKFVSQSVGRPIDRGDNPKV